MGFDLPNIKQPVKVIGHEAITQQIAMRQKILSHFSQEKQVVVRLEKDRLPVVPLIVNVEEGIRFEAHGWGYFLPTKICEAENKTGC